jgi:hypothetical protein
VGFRCSPERSRLNDHLKGRPRPPYLRALGRAEPPTEVEVDGVRYSRREIFKHDSWAATAVYGDGVAPVAPGSGEGQDEKRIVCKFNRLAPLGFIPMRWLGRFLARREIDLLAKLQGVTGIPGVCRDVRIDGKRVRHVSAHAFIEGQPLSLASDVDRDFFDSLDRLVRELHVRRIAYVDLHKQENVIVGKDGNPYLMDFQISLQVPNRRWWNSLLRILCDCDRYHIAKHRSAHNIHGSEPQRPWIIRIHRRIGRPLRTLRRKLLVWIGVRRGDGFASTEVAPEVGLRV